MPTKIKKIIFVTATRADYGKIKSLIKSVQSSNKFEIYIVATGIHMMKKYGKTVIEIKKNFKKNVLSFSNQHKSKKIENILCETVNKFSKIVNRISPDLIVLHGDRIEALGAAISGSLNHILTAHIEGGEVSGNIDDSIRHAVTKLSHVHFVGNKKAARRIYNMGENIKSIFTIGSPDIDILKSDKLPNLRIVKKRYGIPFKNYSILIWHPVTSEKKFLEITTKKLMNFLKKSGNNFIVIHPNNDPGGEKILKVYKKYKNSKNFIFFKSLRFEYFIQLLKNANFIVGNSSSAIYEAIILKTPSINIGTRQTNRIKSKTVLNLQIKDLNNKKINFFLKNYKPSNKSFFGDGTSSENFLKILSSKKLWNTSTQKYFIDNKFIKL